MSSPSGARGVRKVLATNTPPGFNTRLISAMAAWGLGLQAQHRQGNQKRYTQRYNCYSVG
jgi:hypothetical protein